MSNTKRYLEDRVVELENDVEFLKTSTKSLKAEVKTLNKIVKQLLQSSDKFSKNKNLQSIPTLPTISETSTKNSTTPTAAEIPKVEEDDKATIGDDKTKQMETKK